MYRTLGAVYENLWASSSGPEFLQAFQVMLKTAVITQFTFIALFVVFLGNNLVHLSRV